MNNPPSPFAEGIFRPACLPPIPRFQSSSRSSPRGSLCCMFMVVNRPITRPPPPKPQDLVRSLTLFVSFSSISSLLEADPGRSNAVGLGRAHRLEPKGPTASLRPSVCDVLQPSCYLLKLILFPKDSHTNSMRSLRCVNLIVLGPPFPSKIVRVHHHIPFKHNSRSSS